MGWIKKQYHYKLSIAELLPAWRTPNAVRGSASSMYAGHGREPDNAVVSGFGIGPAYFEGWRTAHARRDNLES